MKLLPAAHVKHRIPGRTRIRVEARRGDTAYFRELQQRLSACPGIHRLEINPSTGSLLILHAVELEDLARFAEEQGLFRLATLYPPTTVPLKHWVSENLKELDRGLKVMSGEALDLASVILVVLVGLAIYQALEGHLMAPAVTLLWYALTTLPILGARE